MNMAKFAFIVLFFFLMKYSCVKQAIETIQSFYTDFV